MSDVLGFQAVRAVLRESPGLARNLFVLRGRRDARVNELIDMAKREGVRHQSMDSAWFRRRAGDVAHQGVLLECAERALAKESELMNLMSSLPHDALILVLDGVTDPRNFGACLRCASGAGVDAVIVPKRNSAPLSPITLKTAQGAVEDLLIVEVTNLARTLKSLAQQGVWIVGTDDEADMTYSDFDANCAVAVVMGSEGKGLRRLTKDLCDQLVNIPMAGSVASLNVSVATGVVLYEIVRQRTNPSGGGEKTS